MVLRCRKRYSRYCSTFIDTKPHCLQETVYNVKRPPKGIQRSKRLHRHLSSCNVKCGRKAPVYYKPSVHDLASTYFSITIVPEKDRWPEAMRRHRNLSLICQRAAAWEDCRLSLLSPYGTTRLGCSRGMMAGSLASLNSGWSEEGRKEYPRRRASAVPLLH